MERGHDLSCRVIRPGRRNQLIAGKRFWTITRKNNGSSSTSVLQPRFGGVFHEVSMTAAVMIVSLFIGFVAGVGVTLWWGARSMARMGR